MKKLLNCLLGEELVSELGGVEETLKLTALSFAALVIIFGGLWLATVLRL